MSQSLFLYFLGSDSGTHVVKTAPRFPSVPPSKPMVEGGEQSSPPTHPRWAPTGREVVCVFVTVAKTLCYLAVRGCIRCVSGVRDKERQSRLWSSSGSSRGGSSGRARPHLLASVEVMVATEARPLLGRVNKTDGPRPGMIKDETWIHLHQS